MMYKIADGSVITQGVLPDLQLVIDHINEKGYKVVDGTSIFTQRGKSNIFDKCFMEVAEMFTGPLGPVKLEFSKLGSKGLIVPDNGPTVECTDIPKPIPAKMPHDIIEQFNRIKKINVDPCSYEYTRETLAGEIPMTKEEYKAAFQVYVIEYNQCCKLWWEMVDGKKIYPFKSYTWTNLNHLTPQIELNNFTFERGARRSIRAKLQYDGTALPEALGLISEYLTAMKVPDNADKFSKLGLKNSYKTIASYVLMHWMWLVKRNLHDNSNTCEEIFMNIFGGQGSGKSTFIETLGNALQFFYAEADIKKVDDPRESKIFTNKRIVFFDEFGSKARLTNDEVTALKKLITTDTIQQRLMRTTEHVALARKFTGISATNINISEIVKDETGARRYFELITDTEYSSEKASHFDFNYLDGKKVTQENGKDAYEDIWKVVDDSLEEGYLSMFPEIRDDLRKIQGTYVPMSSSLQFMQSEECRYVSKDAFKTAAIFKASFTDSDAYQVVGIQDLYAMYLKWTKDNNLEHAKTRGNFKKDIETLDILIEEVDKGYRSSGDKNLVNMYYVFTGV